MSGHQPEVVFGVKLARHLTLYIVGALFVLIISFVHVFVLTRIMPRSQYGTLTLLIFWSSALMMLFNLGSMQGTLRAVFGQTGDDDVDGEDEDVDPEEIKGALGSGVVGTFFVCAAGILIIWPFSGQLADLIVGDSTKGSWIMLAAATGAFGSLLRLTSNVLRLERRPMSYIAANALRPTLILGPTIVLVTSGYGVGGAIGAAAIGTAIAFLIVLWMTRRAYTITFTWENAREIIRRGTPVIPVVLALWTVQNVDVFVLSRYVSHADLAPYRVAGQFGVAVTVCTRGFFYAWAPLSRETSFRALAERHGGHTMRGAMITYFVLMCLAMLIGLTVASSTFALVAPGSYAGLSLLIPLVAGGFFVHGSFVVIYRASAYPEKLRNYGYASILSLVGFVGGVMIWVPWLGPPGAALSVMTGFALGFIFLFTHSQRSEDPIPMQYKNIAGGGVIATAIILAGNALNAQPGRYELLLAIVAMVFFAILCLVTGVVPRGHQAPLRRIVGSLARLRAGHIDPEEALVALSPADREILQLAVVHRRTPQQIADQLGQTRQDIHLRLVEVLRTLADESEETEQDTAIGEYLFFRESVAQQDALRTRLWVAGAQPDDVRELEATIEVLDRASDSAWKGQSNDGTNGGRKRRRLTGVGRR